MSGLEEFGNEMVEEAIGKEAAELDDVNPGYDVDTGTMVADPPEDPPATAPVKEDPPAAPPKKDAEPPASVFGSLASDKDDEDTDDLSGLEKNGLLKTVKELRGKNRQLKAQLEEKPQTPPAGETVDVVAQILGDVDDDELVTVEQQRKILKAQEESLRNVVRSELQASTQSARSKDAVKLAMDSEKAARGKYKDFDTAIQAANKARLLTQEDFAAALASEDPAEVLYRTAKGTLDTLGSYFGVTPSVTPGTADPQPETDGTPTEGTESPEDIFREAFGEEE